MKTSLFKYNKHNLRYDNVNITLKQILLFIIIEVIIAIILLFILSELFSTPKELKLKKEILNLKSEINIISHNVNNITTLYNSIEERDSVIYQSIYMDTLKPINKFETGYISDYNGTLSDSIMNIGDKITRLEDNLETSSYRFQLLLKDIIKNKDRLAHIPAIQPISNKNLEHTSSGFGWRIHPIYHVRKMHNGMDYVGKIGTPIYATGDGTVIFASDNIGGYGNCVKINHGYGYITVYGHLSKIVVKINQKIKRNQIIGLLGNSGLSTGPHLHYEVVLNTVPQNPIKYYFNDLTAKQYQQMIDIVKNINMSLD